MTVNMILAPRASTDAAFRESNQSHRKTLAGLVAATICFALATSIAVNYFLASWALGIALVIYAVALLHWPALWLAVISAALPVLDLTPWTGWTQVGAPDLSLVTIGILALRAPPRRADFPLDGFPAVVLVLSLISYFLSVAHGFGLPGPEGGSDNPYLRPDTALRPAKGGFFGARAAASSRRENAYAPRRDGLVGCRDDSGTGPRRSGGRGRALCLHRSLRLHDRLPCRRNLLQHECRRWPYRRLHRNGASLLLVCLLRPRPLTLLAMLGIASGVGYALVVSYARAAYAPALISTLIVGLGWTWAARRHRHTGAAAALALPALVVMLVGGIFMNTFGSGFIAERLRTVAPDLARREGNWSGGLALRDDSPAITFFGMGLGTYPRIVLARKQA